MAVNRIYIEAPPEDVFAILANPDRYGHWVVGSSQIRDVEGVWPAEGSTFHHTQGVGPLGIKDTTSVLESAPGERLVMEVRGRPLMVARVEMELAREGNGTRVTMTETPIRGWLGRSRNRLVDKMIALRNAQSLRRLRRLFERSA